MFIININYINMVASQISEYQKVLKSSFGPNCCVAWVGIIAKIVTLCQYNHTATSSKALMILASCFSSVLFFFFPSLPLYFSFPIPSSHACLQGCTHTCLRKHCPRKKGQAVSFKDPPSPTSCEPCFTGVLDQKATKHFKSPTGRKKKKRFGYYQWLSDRHVVGEGAWRP